MCLLLQCHGCRLETVVFSVNLFFISFNFFVRKKWVFFLSLLSQFQLFKNILITVDMSRLRRVAILFLNAFLDL